MMAISLIEHGAVINDNVATNILKEVMKNEYDEFIPKTLIEHGANVMEVIADIPNDQLYTRNFFRPYVRSVIVDHLGPHLPRDIIEYRLLQFFI